MTAVGGVGTCGYPDSVQQHDFRFLPPTPANLARVAVTIPPGYKRAAS